MADAPLPLDGVRVVAVEQAIAAPLCTRHLADLGAEVVKIERPGTGDFARHCDTTVDGLSSHFVWVSRGKRSVALDLKSDEGADLFARLVDRADILVSNHGARRDGPAGLRPRHRPCRAPCAGALQHLGLRQRRALPRAAFALFEADELERLLTDHAIAFGQQREAGVVA